MSNAWKIFTEEKESDLLDRYKNSNAVPPKVVEEKKESVFATSKENIEDIIQKEFEQQKFNSNTSYSMESNTFEEEIQVPTAMMKLKPRKFVATTLNDVDSAYEVIGVVTGSVVHSYENISDFSSQVKDFYNGEVDSYGDFLEKVREDSQRMMEEKAKVLGANACLGMSFQTNDIMGEIVEFVCIATAVKYRR